MNFYEDAKKYAAMGMWVLPIRPGSKLPLTAHGVKDASNELAQLKAWGDAWPDAGIGIAGRNNKVGDVCILEFDQKPTISTWAKDRGLPTPETRIHLSGGKQMPHFLFAQTEKSLPLGNYSGKKYCEDPNCPEGIKKGGLHEHEWFSFRAFNYYVVAPPSIHPDTGNPYTVFVDIAPQPIPDWLVDAIVKYGRSEKQGSKEMGARPVSDEFDFNHLMEWMRVSIACARGAWQGPDICPAAGYKHEGSGEVGCAFYWDGESVGFKCHAAECPSNTERKTKPNGKMEGGMGCLMRLLSAKYGAYDGEIWPQDSIEELLEEMGVESADEFVDLSGVEYADEESPLLVLSPPQAEPQAPAADKPKKVRKVLIGRELVDDGKFEKQMIGVRASDIKPRIMRWLWPGKIPKGKPALWVGKPGCGKTLSLLDLAARLSSGRDWPDGQKNEWGPRIVLYASTEDDLRDTLVPRLMAAGANLENIIFPQLTIAKERLTAKGKEVGEPRQVKRNPNLAKDLEILRDCVRDTPEVALVVLDPLSSYTGDVDANKAKDVKPVLDALGALCAETGLTIVGIMHYSKRTDTSGSLDRVSGSVTFGATMRTVWEISRDPDDRKKIRMALSKTNYNIKHGLTYHIESAPVMLENEQGVMEETSQAVVAWDGELEENADELLAEQREKDQENKKPKDSQMELAKALIRSSLPMTPPDLFAKAAKEGISRATIYRAKEDLEATDDPVYSEHLTGKEYKWWLTSQWRKRTTEPPPMVDVDVM